MPAGSQDGCTKHPCTHLPADAQRRYVTKQQAFGAACSGEGATAAELPSSNPFAAGSGAAPAWQQRLCSAEQLAGGLPPFRMLNGTCALTSRKVGRSWCRLLASLLCLPSVGLSDHSQALACCPATQHSALSSRSFALIPCPLQFPKLTVRAVGRLFNDCSAVLQLLGPAACPPPTQAAHLIRQQQGGQARLPPVDEGAQQRQP